MSVTAKHMWVAVLGGCLASAAAALGADRPASEILKEIDAAKMPAFDPSKQQDTAYIKEFSAKMQEFQQKRAELILELYKVAPASPHLRRLLPQRWAVLMRGPKAGEIEKEIDDVIANSRFKELRVEAAFLRAQARLMKSLTKSSPDLSGVDEFMKLFPEDQRASSLLYMAAGATSDTKVRAALEERLIKDFAESPFAAMIKGARKQREAVGKPFELEFTDAIKGSTVSMKNLKGKVVVVDFWATWCGPCVGEMPSMKELYAKYRDQGVEFIGISLDVPKEQGGLDRLTKFVKENGIQWPQYYQGNGWQSEFSKLWGINAIPSMFVVDAEGKLYSVEARGKLEQILPELLKKKGASAGAQSRTSGL